MATWKMVFEEFDCAYANLSTHWDQDTFNIDHPEETEVHYLLLIYSGL